MKRKNAADKNKRPGRQQNLKVPVHLLSGDGQRTIGNCPATFQFFSRANLHQDTRPARRLTRREEAIKGRIDE